MARKKGSAQYTAHLAVAVTPEQKQDLIDEAARRGVTYSVAARWAIDEWLAKNAHKPNAKSS